jgi:hypothetical protein
MYLAPAYYSQQLYQRAAGGRPLGLQWPNGRPEGLSDADPSAVLSADGRSLRLYAVNLTPKPRPFRLRLVDPLPRVTKGTRFVLRDTSGANDPEAMNTRDVPTRIAVESGAVTEGGRELRCSLEPYSLTLLELELGR